MRPTTYKKAADPCLRATEKLIKISGYDLAKDQGPVSRRTCKLRWRPERRKCNAPTPSGGKWFDTRDFP